MNMVQERANTIKALADVLAAEQKVDEPLMLTLNRGVAAYLLGELRTDDPLAVEALVDKIDMRGTIRALDRGSISPCWGALIHIGKPASLECLKHPPLNQSKREIPLSFAVEGLSWLK